MIDSWRFVSQSNCLNYSNKDCDWLILACFIGEQYTADATFTRLASKIWFENLAECVGKLLDSLYTLFTEGRQPETSARPNMESRRFGIKICFRANFCNFEIIGHATVS